MSDLENKEPKTDYIPTDFIPEPIQPVPDQPTQESVPPIPPVASPTYGEAKPFLPSYNVNAFAIISVVMGMVGLCTDSGLIAGILAIAFSQMAKQRLNSDDALGEKFTKAGLVMGIIAIAFIIIGAITGAALFGIFSSSLLNSFK